MGSEIAEATEFILEPEAMADTNWSSGVRLSGGQRQRLGLAERFTGNACSGSDEATSALIVTQKPK